MGQVFRIGNKCMKLDCSCCKLDNKLREDDGVTPPFHDRCDCFLVDDITRRLGKFEIAADMIEQWPDQVLWIMSRCIITRAEFMFHKRAFEYVAYSPDFEAASVPYGEPIPIPEYLWEFNLEKEKLRAIRTDSLPPAPTMPGLEAVLAKAKHNE